jgi:ethanolamine-phosphate phospho-lyase
MQANDLALQLAFAARPGRKHVAVMDGAYHGHNISMMACSPYKFWAPKGAGKADWVHVLPTPDSYRCARDGLIDLYRATGMAACACSGGDASLTIHRGCACRQRNMDGRTAAQAVVRAASDLSGCRLAAFFCESALSCAGQIMLPEGYLQEVYSAMRSEDVICIADEVQCGLGRTGSSFWCFEKQVLLREQV